MIKMLHIFQYSKSILNYVSYCFFIVSLIIFLYSWLTYYYYTQYGYYNFPAFEKEPKVHDIKYILLWSEFDPIISERNKHNKFPDNRCKVDNCIFTKDRYLLNGDYSKFDAIIFTENDLANKGKPEKSTSNQIYIFTSLESSYNWPACELYNDNFFNWTVTFRLDSDIPWSYIYVRNATGHIVAPNKAVAWTTSKDPITPHVRSVLMSKKKAAAWLVSNCDAENLRDTYLSDLQKHMYHYSLQIDVFGGCTKMKCFGKCDEMLKKDYYFYMAFENSFAEDYVTEKVLHGYNNYVVPIVYGGANYSRFLPPGSYINAREYHPYNLAYLIYECIKNPKKYEQFFKWTISYNIENTAIPTPNHPMCNLCEALNSKKASKAPVYKKFREWWNGINGMKWCLSSDYWNETSLLRVDGSHVIKMY